MAARRRGRTRPPGGPESGRPAATRSAPTDVPPPSGPALSPDAPTTSARTRLGTDRVAALPAPPARRGPGDRPSPLIEGPTTTTRRRSYERQAGRCRGEESRRDGHGTGAGRRRRPGHRVATRADRCAARRAGRTTRHAEV